MTICIRTAVLGLQRIVLNSGIVCVLYENGIFIHVHSLDRRTRNLTDLIEIVNHFFLKKCELVIYEPLLHLKGKDDPMAFLILQIF